jgi:hypothetical protein
MKDEIRLGASIDAIEGELEFFYHQQGGFRLLPQLQRDANNTAQLVKYLIIDGDSQAAILLRPNDDDGCVLTINSNDTERWALQLGVPGRSELGVNTFLGTKTSERCEAFCRKFVEHLRDAGFTNPKKTKRNTGRPSWPEDVWAREQIRQGRDKDEVRKEWITRLNPDRKLQNPTDSFQKNILDWVKKRSD